MTQPARKKETATQLELLEAELTAARKVTARYRTAMENAEKRHGAAEDAQAVAQYRYDCALVASWGDTPDWMTLLDGDEDRSSVMYELAREGLERLGLGTSMINMETGQRDEAGVWQGKRAYRFSGAGGGASLYSRHSFRHQYRGRQSACAVNIVMF